MPRVENGDPALGQAGFVGGVATREANRLMQVLASGLILGYSMSRQSAPPTFSSDCYQLAAKPNLLLVWLRQGLISNRKRAFVTISSRQKRRAKSVWERRDESIHLLQNFLLI
jgi:hypothetical protein